jgi:hypothetical protein
MGIISSTFGLMGQDGITPRRVQLVTTDNLATITTAGYLTEQGVNPSFIYPTDIFDVIFNYNVNTTVGSYIELLPTIVHGVITLNAASSTVTLPTITDHIAVYSNTAGGLTEDAANAINGGNIQAGLSGTAGVLSSYPSTASKGHLTLAAVANTGNTITTISNAAMGQASVVSIPDPGVATSKFVLTDSAGVQHITTGSLSVDLGNIAAGSSGHAGTISSFPGTASKGSLIMAAVNNTGNTTTTISNAAMGQASVISIPDPAGATADFVLAPSALVSGNLVKASGTAGLIVDQGFAMKSVAAAAAAGGAAAQSFTDAFCTTGSVVIGNWVTQTTPEQVVTIVPGNGSFIVTSTGDAGAGTFSYIITK